MYDLTISLFFRSRWWWTRPAQHACVNHMLTCLQPPSSIYSPPSSTYTPPPPSSSSSSSESAITSTPIPTEIYTSITTVTGRVQTVIVTPSSTPTDDATLGQSSTSGGHGVSTGKVVGIVLGVALGIGLIIGILVWLWFRRKRRQDMRELSPEGSFVAERTGENSSGGNSVPSRQVSQMSTSGLLGKAPRIMTNGLMGGFGSAQCRHDWVGIRSEECWDRPKAQPVGTIQPRRSVEQCVVAGQPRLFKTTEGKSLTVNAATCAY